MRYFFAVLAVLMLLAVAVQYNDPDGPLWMVYYGVPAVWCMLAAVRPALFANSAARGLLAISVVAAIALTAWYWPTAIGFWHERVWQMGLTDPQAAKIAEESREGMGMMIATAVLVVVAIWGFAKRPQRQLIAA
jgi:ABC-type Na+ efflux pump permease subunit